MPQVVQPHKDQIHGRDAVATGIMAVQAAVGGVTISKSVDGQHLAGKIIELQKRLNALGKLASNKINISIDDQHLSAKLIEVENAANT